MPPKSRRYIVTVEFYVRASSEARAQQIVEKELDVWGFDIKPFGGERSAKHFRAALKHSTDLRLHP